MRHAAVYTRNEGRRICLILLSAAAVIGAAAGAFMFRADDSGIRGILLRQYFTPPYSGNTLSELFRSTFLTEAAYLSAIYLTGFSSVGQPFAVFLMGMRGVGAGSCMAVMYAENGIGALLKMVIPSVAKAAVLIVITALAVRESLHMSNTLFCSLLNRERSTERENSRSLKLYSIKFAVLILITLAAAAADAALNYLLTEIV